MTPGAYDISGGMAEVKPDGRIIFRNLEFSPIQKPEPEKPQNVKECWQEANKLQLTYSAFRAEVDRIGHLDRKTNCLNLTGRRLKALYQFLAVMDCLPRDLSMVDVYQMFAASFRLKIKSHSSMQRIIDDDNDFLFWSQTFAFCVLESNATKNVGDSEK